MRGNHVQNMIDRGVKFRRRPQGILAATTSFQLPIAIPLKRKVTLCGSTRFKEAYEYFNRLLTLRGNIVYSVAFFGHIEGVNPAEKGFLDAVHCLKIDNSDEIFVIDIYGYIGQSTRAEINHALSTGKKVRYLSVEYPKYKMQPRYQVGDKIKFTEEKQRYTIQAISDRYAVCTKPFNCQNTVLYTVVDFFEGVRGPNDLVMNSFDYATREGCQEFLNHLLLPPWHPDYQQHQISHRHRCKLLIEA